MEDQELEAIRAKRLSQLQGSIPGYNAQNQSAEALEEKKRAAEDMKNNMLAQILDQDARARLNTIKVAKPDRGQMLEDMLIQMAQRGQIISKMSENELKGILERVSVQMQKKTVVKFDRRRTVLDSDDELELDV
uniref:Putative programmed cell death protein n=1 Tax=Panstrongylus lignarius TaxID=156445 RepID=A0A224XWD0_9HEMI